MKTNVLNFSRLDVLGASLLVFCIALFSPRLAAATPTNFWLGGANFILPWSDGNNWILRHPADGSVENILISQGGVLGDFSFDNQNTFNLETPRELDLLSTTTITNEGTINNIGSTLVNAGTLTNNAGGTLGGGSMAGAFINRAGGTLTNNGTINAGFGTLTNNAGGTFTNNGNAGTGSFNSLTAGLNILSNAGIVTNTGTLGTGTLTNQAGGTLTNTGTIASFGGTNGGTFINAVGGTLANLGGGFTNNAGGTLTNNGTINAGFGTLTNNAGGTFTNAGTVTSATFTNTGLFVEEIAGTSLGDFGELLSNDIVLGGMLDVVLLNGFTPASGDSFDFIADPGTRTGTFASETFPALPPGLSWTLTYDDSLRRVELEVTGTSSVPEPSTLVLLAGSITSFLLSRFLLSRHRQRKKNSA
jgi:hypothetical protein